MPDSTARRERLASPLVLALLAGLFALAFLVLVPGRDALRSLAGGAGDAAPDGVDGTDAVDLAWLRARAAAGRPVGDEVRRRVSALLAAGRPDEARALLARFPDTALGARDAFGLELEAAAAALAAGNGAAPAAPSADGPDPAFADALAARLERLRDEPGLGDAATLARGAWLSHRLSRPALTATLYARLAETDAAAAPTAWAECGRSAAAAGARTLAIDCYRRAIDSPAPDATPGDVFDLRLALLGQLGGDAHEAARGATIDALLARDVPSGALGARRLETLARTLLALERPGDAAPLYGRLAELGPEAERGTRLLEAARWSEAAGRPDLAAAWVERAAERPGGAERARLQRRVEALLLAAGRERDALERVAARVAANPGDAQALRDGVALARRVGDLERASAWNEALLDRAPDDADALRRAIDLALARPDLEAARAAAERAVHRLPDEREARVRLAQVAEWSGEPGLALAQWRALAAVGSGTDEGNGDGTGATTQEVALRELVRLAELTLRPVVAADAATELALLAPPTPRDVERVVRLHELDGRPDAAAAAIERVVAAHGETPEALESLARLHERHGDPRRALDARERRAELPGLGAGADVEGTLARIRLHWRLNERDAAGRLAERLRGRDLDGIDAATATLLSEIAFRERRTWLALAAAPAILALEDPNLRARHGRRLLAALRDEGRLPEAIAAADRLWRASGDPDFAIRAMNLALESGDPDAAAAYLVAGSVAAPLAAPLGAEPAYWTAAAALRLQDDDVGAARADYERALELAPDDPDALAALLWLLVDAGERDELARLLDAHGARAATEPALWSVFALGRLGLGEPAASLPWFERLSDRIGADYGLLLGYADALEASGRVDAALRLRRHAFEELRPALLEALGTGAAGREALLGQYARLALRFGALDERWADVLLGDPPGEGTSDAAPSAADAWREDVAIAWLLSTERHEHARAVIARLHGERAGTLAWQALAVALAANDLASIRTLLDAGEPLSVADRILALRAVGDERAAYALAGDAMRADPVPATRDFAADRYAELRASRPSWAEGFVRRSSLGGLDTLATGVAARHTFGNGFGLALEAARATLDSDALELDGLEARDSVELSLHRGGSRRALRLDLGIDSGADDDVVSAGLAASARSRDGARELLAELALSEGADESAELAAAATRDRASLVAERGFGRREYVRLRADATELRTRAGDDFVARGAAGGVELGTRGAFGGTEWGARVGASHARRTRADALPDELRLSPDSTLDSVLAARASTLALGVSLARGGGVRTDFPRTGVPRWFVEGVVDHDWPARSFGLRVDTGLGLRVLGGDELAFSLSHDTRGSAATGTGASALGMAYRFHF